MFPLLFHFCISLGFCFYKGGWSVIDTYHFNIFILNCDFQHQKVPPLSSLVLFSLSSPLSGIKITHTDTHTHTHSLFLTVFICLVYLSLLIPLFLAFLNHFGCVSLYIVGSYFYEPNRKYFFKIQLSSSHLHFIKLKHFV